MSANGARTRRPPSAPLGERSEPNAEGARAGGRVRQRGRLTSGASEGAEPRKTNLARMGGGVPDEES